MMAARMKPVKNGDSTIRQSRFGCSARLLVA
jgi:hypothetical protein